MALDTERLIDGAREVLRANDLGGWTKPAPALYPHQWNWDSCFIAIGLSHFDPERAMQEIRSLLRGQWANGLVPQIVFNPEEAGYFPGPDVWQSERSADAPKDLETSGITQPPVLATALLAVYRNAPDKDRALPFLRETYPKALAYHRYFYEERNPDRNGLIVVVHPWESGLDNSPPYLDAGARVRLTYRPRYERLDTLHVQAADRPTDRDYDLYVWLLEQMRNLDWDQRRYLQSAPLQVQDVLFNSILCRANRDLAAIAEIVGEDPDQAKRWHQETARSINDHLWDEASGTYYSYDRVAGSVLEIDTIAAFGPLYGDVALPDRAARLVEKHLLNPAEYWPEGGYPVPTTSMASPWFNPQKYWLGPTWVATNWLVIKGLLDPRPDLAAALAQRTLEAVARSGYREYFNPRTGEGYGTDSFSWTAALSIDLATRQDR
jgi:hypothetical protein